VPVIRLVVGYGGTTSEKMEGEVRGCLGQKGHLERELSVELHWRIMVRRVWNCLCVLGWLCISLGRRKFLVSKGVKERSKKRRRFGVGQRFVEFGVHVEGPSGVDSLFGNFFPFFISVRKGVGVNVIGESGRVKTVFDFMSKSRGSVGNI